MFLWLHLDYATPEAALAVHAHSEQEAKRQRRMREKWQIGNLQGAKQLNAPRQQPAPASAPATPNMAARAPQGA